MFKKPDDLKRLDRLIVEREKELGAPLTPSPVLSLRTRLKGALLALAGSFATPRRDDEQPVVEMRFSPKERMYEDPNVPGSHTARALEKFPPFPEPNITQDYPPKKLSE